jgi:hypothetical protein
MKGYNEITFSKDEINHLLDIVKHKGYYDPSDCRNAVLPFDDLCGVNAMVFHILELALKELSIKTQNEKITFHFMEYAKEKNPSTATTLEYNNFQSLQEKRKEKITLEVFN